MIRVLIADDQDLVRLGLSTLIGSVTTAIPASATRSRVRSA